MKKRDFIQQATIEFMPQVDWDIDKAIRYAEKLWQRLEQQGYGDKQESKPRSGVNYYQKLTPDMREQFDKFWIAFNKGQAKNGKQGAAMRWWQMGEISPAECDKIIAAAEQAAIARKNLPPGQTPIMAQGWLNEMRYLDGDPSATEQKTHKTKLQTDQLREAVGALNHAKKMAASCSDDFWVAEVERLAEALKKLRKN